MRSVPITTPPKFESSRPLSIRPIPISYLFWFELYQKLASTAPIVSSELVPKAFELVVLSQPTSMLPSILILLVTLILDLSIWTCGYQAA